MSNLKTNLPDRILTRWQAEDFLKELVSNNEHFHSEDDANDIVWNFSPAPTKDDCARLNNLMIDISFIKDFDPCEFILSIVNK